MKVVNSFALLESSSNDAGLVLLVDAVCILELEHPLAGDELDAGWKSRDLDDTPAAHLLEGMILKIQRSFPEYSIRRDKSVDVCMLLIPSSLAQFLSNSLTTSENGSHSS